MRERKICVNIYNVFTIYVNNCIEGWIIKKKLQTLLLEQRKEVCTKAHKKGFKMLTHLEMKAMTFYMVKDEVFF